jgi:hypothetical protein
MANHDTRAESPTRTVRKAIGILGIPVAIFFDEKSPSAYTAWLHPPDWYAIERGQIFRLADDVSPIDAVKIGALQALRVQPVK